jgi:hypothetical protein
MTPIELKCFGMSYEDIQEQYIDSLTGRLTGLEMVVSGILSDVQHMIEYDMPKDAMRKQLNIAKYILSKAIARQENL